MLTSSPESSKRINVLALKYRLSSGRHVIGPLALEYWISQLEKAGLISNRTENLGVLVFDVFARNIPLKSPTKTYDAVSFQSSLETRFWCNELLQSHRVLTDEINASGRSEEKMENIG